jgi:transposase InsO family protein
VLTISERRACRALGQHRSTQRKAPRGKEDEEQLTADLIELARQYGRYGYRKITALLREAGWRVNDKRVERIWRREGLKVPRNSSSAGGCGSRTGPASGFGPRTAITSGPTTLSRIAPMTGASSGCST